VDGQPHLLSESLKERNSQLGFQSADLNGNVGLHAMRLFGGSRETEFTRKDAEYIQLTDFHGEL
jgi:hypothetical protein